jgi:hypothetical protein
VAITIAVTNSGDADAPFTDVKLELPIEAMYVDSDGFASSQIDLQQKVMGGSMDVPAGTTRAFRVRMIVPRESGGRVLAPDLTVRYLHLGVEFHGHATRDIGSRVDPAVVAFGRFGVSAAGVVVLMVLVAFPLLALGIGAMMPGGRAPRDESGVIRGSSARTRGAATAALAILLPLGFWAMFAAMGLRDWRAITEWPRTSCTITDSRLRQDESASTAGANTGGLRRTRTTTTRSFEPLLALRYEAAGRDVVSTGFHTGSHLRIGGRSGAASALSELKIGSSVPCWYDPSDAADVVVRNGFGGAYLFALFPLPVAVFAFYRTRALVRRRR